MSSIDEIFKQKHPFLGFVVAGDGGVDYCVECCLELVAGGVDILEIGFPFSDPVADGPVIQRASARSLKGGTTSSTILEIARRIRQKSQVPLLLFSYCNPLLKRGNEYLFELKSAGFDAILTVDLPPPEEQGLPNGYYDALKNAGLQPVFLVSPSTDEGRLKKIGAMSEGFLYYACQKGTTGMRKALPEDFQFHISRIRQQSSLPVAAGFGIADRDNAYAALKYADGFVVGSAFVALMENKASPEDLKLLAQRIDPRVPQ